MSDRVAVLRDGRIEQVAEPETLYEEPERAFVARFIGENNRLYGRVLSIVKDICNVQIGEHVVQGVRIAPCQPGDAGIKVPVALFAASAIACLAVSSAQVRSTRAPRDEYRNRAQFSG